MGFMWSVVRSSLLFCASSTQIITRDPLQCGGGAAAAAGLFVWTSSSIESPHFKHWFDSLRRDISTKLDHFRIDSPLSNTFHLFSPTSPPNFHPNCPPQWLLQVKPRNAKSKKKLKKNSIMAIHCGDVWLWLEPTLVVNLISHFIPSTLGLSELYSLF